MMKKKKNASFHGSDLERIASFYGISQENLTGFGSNVNPLGISPKLKDALIHNADAIMHYPDRDYSALRDAISLYTGAEKSHLLIGNGATELIGLLSATLKPKKALLIGPSYSEYERVIKREGGTLETYYLKEEDDFSLNVPDLLKALPGRDLLIICNPNNPTGTVITQTDLVKILDAARACGVFTMIDETYIEFTASPKHVSAIPLTEKYEALFVLRGVSKFFASPGLRLGYAVTGGGKLHDALLAIKDPWTVHTLAAECAPAMFSDTDYIEKTKTFTLNERSRVIAMLKEIKNLKVYPCDTNFILMKILKPALTSTALFERGVKSGLVIRDCASFSSLGEKHFRISLMMPKDNDRLAAFLKKELE